MTSRFVRRFYLAGAMIAAAAAAWTYAARADEPAKNNAPADTKPVAAKKKDTSDDGFLRVLRDKNDRPLEMQTAIVRYSKPGDKSGLHVDLIGAVHIGDAAYYARLNKQFKRYDALLYELVAPEEHRVPDPKKGGSSHPIGMMQKGLKEMLELAFQLDCIDYRKPNFVHADMSPDEFSKSMEDRGESIWTMIFRAMGQSIATQSKGGTNDMQLLMALFDPNRAMALKRAMAEQFEDLEQATGIFGGPEGSTIITERNKVALDVLKQEIAAGKKNLGIFYGAAHLPDMEKRLESDFGLKRRRVTWITAWDLSGKPAKESAPKSGRGGKACSG
ncbi:MAG TPA: hypothetical protein VHZ24_18255 [Pirellulales bacterium]|jgi:hypothetical protein|nr:hypothetical protein [Pirellulales bacterium]